MNNKPTPTIGTRMEFIGLRTEEYEALRAENRRLRKAAKQLSDMQLTGRFVWCPAGMCDQCDKDREAIIAIRKELDGGKVGIKP